VPHGRPRSGLAPGVMGDALAALSPLWKAGRAGCATGGAPSRCPRGARGPRGTQGPQEHPPGAPRGGERRAPRF